MSLGLDQLNQISTRYGLEFSTLSRLVSTENKAGSENVEINNQPSQPAEPRSLNPQLDRLLVNISKATYREVTSQTLMSAELGYNKKSAICKFAAKAEKAMNEITKLPIRQLLDNPKLQTKLYEAVSMQLDFGDRLRELAENEENPEKRFQLNELSLKCDSRGTELMHLLNDMQTLDREGVFEKAKDLAYLKVERFMISMAGSMHGNDTTVTNRFANEIAELENQLVDISKLKNPDDSVVKALLDKAEELSKKLNEGNTRLEMDGDIHKELTTRLHELKQKIESRYDFAFETFKKDMLNKVFGVDSETRARQNLLIKELEKFPKLAAMYNDVMSLLKSMKDGDPPNRNALENILSYDSGTEVTDEISCAIKYLENNNHGLELENDSGRARNMEFFDKIGWPLHEIKAAALTLEEMQERRNQLRTSGLKNMTGEDIVSAFRDGRKISQLLSAKILGANEDSFNAQLKDENVVSTQQLGSGNANTVYKITYRMEDGSPKDFVFKPELGGRAGLTKLLATLGGAYSSLQQSVKLNTLTCDIANMLGVGNLTGKNYVTVLNGQYGLLMEMAPGKTAKEHTGSMEFQDVFKSPKLLGSLAKQLNDLRWLDIATGQSDRHSSNYLCNLSADRSEVKVTAIDNDASFPSFLVGVCKYDLRPRMTFFTNNLKRTCQSLYKDTKVADSRFQELINKVNSNNFIVDTRNAPLEIVKAVRDTFGVHSVSMPKQMSRTMYESLVALDDNAMEDVKKKLENKLAKQECIDATINRLKDLRQIANDLKAQGKIIEDEQWESNEVIEIEMKGGHNSEQDTKNLTVDTKEKNTIDYICNHCEDGFLKREFGGRVEANSKVRGNYNE